MLMPLCYKYFFLRMHMRNVRDARYACGQNT